MTTALLFRQEIAGLSGTVSLMEEGAEEEAEKGLLCLRCSHLITSSDKAMEVNGSHSHLFFNPAGIVYEIGCYANAAGCRDHGPASLEFSWFPGYSWRLSLCSLCMAHLGWFFRSGESVFYGLILKNLRSA